jgi:hypothetical protein
MGLWIRTVIRRCAAGAAPRVQLCFLLALLGCSSGAPDPLSIEPPTFGAGTARIHIALGPGYVEDSLAVSLDHRPFRGAFTVGEAGATGVVPVGPGLHTLSARARFATRGRVRASDDSLRFRTPSPLPPLVSSDPSANAGDVPRTAWIRLTFVRQVSEVGRLSVELSCDGVRHPAAVHLTAPRTLIVDPEGDLEPSARCVVAWRGSRGPRRLRFGTAAAGPPASVIYDRSESLGTAPFPDDFWLRTDPSDPRRQRLEIELPGFEEPDRLLLEALLHGTRTLDGFSPIAHVTLELSEAPDPYSLPWTPEESLDPMASVGLFDVAPESPTYGERIPFRMDVRSDTAWGRVSHSLLVFPSIALEPGGRYGVVVTRRARVDHSRPFDASPFFRAVRDAPARPDEPEALRRVRSLADDVLTAVAEASTPPIRREDVALAVRFSVRHTDDIPADLLAIKREVLAGPPPAIAISRVEGESAEEIARGSEVAAVVRGTWEAPDWREDGLVLSRDPATGRPRRTGTRPVEFVLALPAAARQGPVPVVMYQHGNPGSAEEEVLPQARQTLARAGFAVIGFTDVLNREVSPPGRSESERAYDQTFQIMGYLLILKRIPDYFVQTNAEQLSFLRAIEALAAIPRFDVGVPDVPEGEALFGIDRSKPLTYVGVSEGANHAPAFLAFAPEVRAAALIAGGRRFAEVLVHQRPAAIFAPLAGLGFTQLRPTDIWVMLALFQMIFDRQDAHNFAPYVYRKPFEVAGTTRRASILLTEGLGDSAVPNHVTDALAWALGPIPQLEPAARRVPTLEVAAAPVVGNIDAGTTAAFHQFVPQGVAEIAPTPGCASPPLSPQSANEGHYCVQNAAEALLQRLVFLETALTDEAPLIVNPLTR